MKRLDQRHTAWGLVAIALFGAVGCGPTQSINPYALRRENDQLRAACRQYQSQLAQTRVERENLDKDNEQLQGLYAQEQDARRQAEEESKLAASAPRSAPTLSTRSVYDDDKDFGPPRGRAGSGPSAARGVAVNKKGATNGWLPMSSVPGAQVVRDGDTVRIRVTNTSLFDPGKATLKPGATQVLDRVAATLRRDYPGLLIGIEGHTDSDPIRKSNWKDNHELSMQRAMAVFEYLRTKGGIPSDQLVLAACGPNVPIASNRTSAGKAQNRRVEFVIHPVEARADGASRR